MKITIICYPGMSFTDVLTFLEPLELLKTRQPDLPLDWEFCSYLPIPNGKPGFSLTTSAVGLPLQGYDLLFLPDPKLSENFPGEREWLEWLKTGSEIPSIIALNSGSQFLQKSNFNSTFKPTTKTNQLESYRAALNLIEQITDNDTAKAIKSELKLNNLILAAQLPRTAKVERTSAETQITVDLVLDGSGKANIKTGIPFLDHMVNQIAKHGLFDIALDANGDLEIDSHHTMEDCALAIGEAFRLAAGDRKGIQRMASATIPMDESLAEVTLDFSGRPYAVLHTQWTDETLAEIPTSLFEHFLESFASAARINLFVRVLAGKDNHHMSEAIFKALARALDSALIIDERRKDSIPSTKEVLF
jgi:imidazoleglycerol-phosphate dehydratase